MKTIRMMLITLAVAGIAAQAEDKPGKKPAADDQPVVKKAEAVDKPVVKKPKLAPEGTKPAIKKLPADPNQPAVKKPAADPTKPVVKKPAPDGSKPVVKKPDAGATPPRVKKPGTAPNQGIKKPGADSGKTEFNSILKNCDDDKNGSVTLEEFRQHQPAGKDPGSVDLWFNTHDKDKDGVLTAADFAPPPQKK
ncbi:MAG: hypothetical protein ACKVY0_05475 [Prosthecobacter sp.]|uniref:hypothetical protein n=1 Tax=Prosthecobacter sp. TaxID=1965333 RepID=UPI003903F850